MSNTVRAKLSAIVWPAATCLSMVQYGTESDADWYRIQNTEPLSISTDYPSWANPIERFDLREYQKSSTHEIMESFGQRLLESMTDTKPEVKRLLRDKLWDLL